MNELIIPLDGGRGEPLYQQIYGHIRREIETRRILPGEKLPSTRLLAANLQVSRSTVDLAYEQLYAEGYITSRPCRGYFACEIEGLYRQPETEEIRKTPKPREGASWDFDFALNGIDRDGFPYNTWRKLSRRVLSEDDGTLFQLGDPQGDPGIRREIAAYLRHARGVQCDPEQVVVGQHISSINYMSEFRRQMRLFGEIPRRTMIRHLLIFGTPFVSAGRLSGQLERFGYLGLDENHTQADGSRLDWLLLRFLELYEESCRGMSPERRGSWFREAYSILDSYLVSRQNTSLRIFYFKSLKDGE